MSACLVSDTFKILARLAMLFHGLDSNVTQLLANFKIKIYKSIFVAVTVAHGAIAADKDFASDCLGTVSTIRVLNLTLLKSQGI